MNDLINLLLLLGIALLSAIVVGSLAWRRDAKADSQREEDT